MRRGRQRSGRWRSLRRVYHQGGKYKYCTNLTCILKSACCLNNILQFSISLLPHLSKHSYAHPSIRRLESCCLRAVQLPIVTKQLNLTCEECDYTTNSCGLQGSSMAIYCVLRATRYVLTLVQNYRRNLDVNEIYESDLIVFSTDYISAIRFDAIQFHCPQGTLFLCQESPSTCFRCKFTIAAADFGTAKQQLTYFYFQNFIFTHLKQYCFH